MFFASKEALAEKGVSQVANNVTYEKKCSLLHQIESYIKNLKSFLEVEKKSILNSLCFLKH